MGVIIVPNEKKGSLDYIHKIIIDYIYPHFSLVERAGLHLCVKFATGVALHTVHCLLG